MVKWLFYLVTLIKVEKYSCNFNTGVHMVRVYGLVDITCTINRPLTTNQQKWAMGISDAGMSMGRVSQNSMSCKIII